MCDSYNDIVSHFDSPTLVLSGPGAGKTHLLSDRVKRLLEKGIDRSIINVLAFGRDAAQNMINTLIDRKGHFQLSPDELPYISTMHSLGFEIINETPSKVGLRKKGLSVQANDHVKRLIFRDAALIVGLSDKEAKEACDCKEYGDCNEKEQIAKCTVCRKYWEIMSKCNKIDFDDQIIFACRILENNPDILANYQARCEHLLVDEYQDINAAQFKLIELLSRRYRAGLFVVGDDAQSIYSFRGADPGYILNFKKQFPSAYTPTLAHSRRCHAAILQTATKVLSKYYPDWTGPFNLTYHSKAGDAPFVWHLPSSIGEAEMVARIAHHFINDKKSVLVLAPKKDFFRDISKELRKRKVANECPVSLLPDFINSRLMKAYNFLQWVQEPDNSFLTRLVLEELINRGAAKVPGARKSNRCNQETIQARIHEETRIANLWELVNRKESLLDVIIKTKQEGTLTIIKETLSILINSYTNFKEDKCGDFMKHLALAMGVWGDPTNFAKDFLAAMALLIPSPASGSGFVQLMTMRKAKGLQADIVIIVGLEDDIIPNPSSDIAEEARLFYVSMTRAKEKLYLFHAFKRSRGISFGEELTGKIRSRFLDELGIDSEFKRAKNYSK